MRFQLWALQVGDDRLKHFLKLAESATLGPLLPSLEAAQNDGRVLRLYLVDATANTVTLL